MTTLIIVCKVIYYIVKLAWLIYKLGKACGRWWQEMLPETGDILLCGRLPSTPLGSFWQNGTPADRIAPLLAARFSCIRTNKNPLQRPLEGGTR